MKLAWNNDLMQNLRESKFTLLALSLGLALGFAGGLMLRSQAETINKQLEPTVASPAGISLRVHAGSPNRSREFSEIETAINKMHSAAHRLSLPFTMIDPWPAMHRDFDLMFSDLDSSWPFAASSDVPVLRLSTTEQGDQIKITTDVPGMDEKNLDITVNEDSVIIKGSRTDESSQPKNDKSAHNIERSYGCFERAVSLPCKVQGDKAQAVLKNGVLTITVPKCQEAQSPGAKPHAS